MRLDSSGNVGIGYTTPSSMNSSGNNLVIGSGASSDNTGLTIFSNSNASGSIHFADGTTGADAYRGIITYSQAGNYMRFYTDATERMRITSDGITFNGDTAAANALDDYEEGVYAPTPSISGATGSIAFYANYNRLSYTKIGNQAHINGVLRVESNGVNGGRLNLTLPFTSLNGDEGEGQALFQVQIAAGSGSQASGYFAPVSENSTTLQIQTYTGVASSNDSAVTMAVNSYLFISGTYTTV